MKRILGKECEYCKVTKNELNKFLQKNEQNFRKVKELERCFGLKYKGDLVQIMAFKSGSGEYKSYKFNLFKICTAKNYKVTDGIILLWKYFCTEERVISCVYEYKNISNEYRLILNKHCEFKKINSCTANYYPFSVVYRMDDLTDHTFYIGRTENILDWDKYSGSGIVWRRHKKQHPDKSKRGNENNKNAHTYKRTVIADNFLTPDETRTRELEEIRRYFVYNDNKWVKTDKKCLNVTAEDQGSNYIAPECPECGGKMGRHFATCSQAKVCPECGCVNGHKENCSYNKIEGCPYCGRKTGPHKKGCPLASKKQQYTCPECGSHNKGIHKKTCSQYKEPKGKCEYCGTPPGGKHKKDCPNRPPEEKCPECGYILSSNRHAPTCSHYKKPKGPEPCPICGGTHAHSKNCPKSLKCPECGGANNHHKKTCSQYKPAAPFSTIKKVYCKETNTVYSSAKLVAQTLFKDNGKEWKRNRSGVYRSIDKGNTYDGYHFSFCDDDSEFINKDTKFVE